MRHVQRSESYVSGLECTLSGVLVRSIGYTYSYSYLLWDRDVGCGIWAMFSGLLDSLVLVLDLMRSEKLIECMIDYTRRCKFLCYGFTTSARLHC